MFHRYACRCDLENRRVITPNRHPQRDSRQRAAPASAVAGMLATPRMTGATGSLCRAAKGVAPAGPEAAGSDSTATSQRPLRPGWLRSPLAVHERDGSRTMAAAWHDARRHRWMPAVTRIRQPGYVIIIESSGSSCRTALAARTNRLRQAGGNAAETSDPCSQLSPRPGNPWQSPPCF